MPTGAQGQREAGRTTEVAPSSGRSGIDNEIDEIADSTRNQYKQAQEEAKAAEHDFENS